jgi:hypothetical protein
LWLDRFVLYRRTCLLLNCVGVGGEFVRYDNIDIATDVLFDVLCQRASFRIGGVEEAEIAATFTDADNDLLGLSSLR